MPFHINCQIVYTWHNIILDAACRNIDGSHNHIIYLFIYSKKCKLLYSFLGNNVTIHLPSGASSSWWLLSQLSVAPRPRRGALGFGRSSAIAVMTAELRPNLSAPAEPPSSPIWSWRQTPFLLRPSKFGKMRGRAHWNPKEKIWEEEEEEAYLVRSAMAAVGRERGTSCHAPN
jgi:hypothetical protein